MNYRRYIEYQALAPLSLLQTFVLGVVVGGLTWLTYLGLERFVLSPLLCANNGQVCTSSPTIALVASLVIMSVIGLVLMVRIGLLRPLLIILASVLTLWGFHVWLAGTEWWLGALYAGLLFGLAYVTYTWINRFLFFPLALVLTVVCVVVARLLVGMW